jgi:hypothetical protein
MKKLFFKNRNTKITLLSVALIAIFLTSCGSDGKNEKQTDSNDNSVKPVEKSSQAEPNRQVSYTEFKIGNQDKALFKMVDGGSTEIAIDNNGFIEVKAKFEVVKKFTGKAHDDQAFVSLVALDADGTPIKLSTTTNGEMRSDDSEGKQFLDFLMGEPGSKTTMVFSGSISKEGKIEPDADQTKEAAKKIVGFKVLTDK